MKLELLMVLAAAALLSNLSESRIVSICELKKKLEIIPVAPETKNDTLAKIICELEKISNLNTSLVTVEGHHQAKSTDQPKTATEGNTARPNTATANGTSSKEVSANSSAPSGGRQEHSPPKRKPEGKEKQTSQKKENSSGKGHEDSSKYGIFQLSNSEFCKSGNVQSQNKCHTNCSAFTDDDIMDDTNCVVGQNYWKKILDEASKYCRSQTNTFFNQCN